MSEQPNDSLIIYGFVLSYGHVVPQRSEVCEFGVEDADEVVEEPVGTERRLLIEL